jgi:GT2 family glycosyltransferase
MNIDIITISKDRQPGMNRSEARNYLCKQSSADAYLFTDDDASHDGDWVEQYRRSLEGGSVIVYGPEYTVAHDGRHVIYSTERRELMFHNQNINAPTVNLCYRRDVFWELGGFDEKMNVAEDLDLNYRAVKAGYKIDLNLYAPVYHQARKNFWAFIRQSFWYGYGWAMFERKHKIKLNKPKLREIRLLMFFRCVFAGIGYIYGKGYEEMGF